MIQIKKTILTLVALLAVTTGARAAWTGGTYTATATENLGAITVNGDATLTINSDVTVTINNGLNIASGTLTVTGPGTLVVNGAKGNNGASGWAVPTTAEASLMYDAREAIGNLTANNYLCIGGTGYRAFKPTDAAFSTSSSNIKASTVLRPVATVTINKE